MYYVVAVLYVLSCLMLLLVVLLQQGKGGDMASAFGGGGSQTAFGARAGATVLTKATTILGVLFMLGAIALGIIDKCNRPLHYTEGAVTRYKADRQVIGQAHR